MKKKITVVEKKLGRECNWAQVFDFDKTALIEIDPRQKSKRYMDSMLHEGLHVLFPNESETKIKLAARTLTKLLWEKDFRRIKE